MNIALLNCIVPVYSQSVQVGHMLATVSANYKGKQLAHEEAVNRVFINV
jgi:hypothetical protein